MLGDTWFYFWVFLFFQDVVPKNTQYQSDKWVSHTYPDIWIWLLEAWFLSVAQVLLEGQLEDQKIEFLLSKNCLIGFLHRHHLLNLSLICRSQYLVLIDLIELVGYPGFLLGFDCVGKASLNNGTYWGSLFTWSFHLA